MVMTRAQGNFNSWLRICSLLELSKQMVSFLPWVVEKQVVRISLYVPIRPCMYIHVYIALPMIVGAWLMAVVLL